MAHILQRVHYLKNSVVLGRCIKISSWRCTGSPISTWLSLQIGVPFCRCRFNESLLFEVYIGGPDLGIRPYRLSLYRGPCSLETPMSS